MPYQYQITEQDGYLKIEVNGTRKGENVAEQSLTMWTEVANLCRQRHIDGILAIFHLTGRRSLVNTFDIVEGVKPLLWPELKIAYIDMDEENRQQNSIAETSALSHGINFRTFESIEEGQRWLKASINATR